MSNSSVASSTLNKTQEAFPVIKATDVFSF